MNTYTCKYCHKQFAFDDPKLASGKMSAHTRFCECNPKRQQYLDGMRAHAKQGSLIGNATIKARYKASLRQYTFTCEKCGKDFQKTLSPKQLAKYEPKHHFCSIACAHSHVRTEEGKKEMSRRWHEKHPEYALRDKQAQQKGTHIRKVSRGYACDLRQSSCVICGAPLWLKTTDETTCFNCRPSHPEIKRYKIYDAEGHRLTSQATRAKISKATRLRVANGTHNGYKVRPTASYPEKFWMTVLNNNHIPYEFNKPIKKSSLGVKACCCYFLDFVLPGMIDLEIDGIQHTRSEQHASDQVRDRLLTAHGWRVYRIPWCNINSAKGSTRMKQQIDDFLKWYGEQAVARSNRTTPTICEDVF